MKFFLFGFLLFTTLNGLAQIDTAQEADAIRKLRLANNQAMAKHDLRGSLSIMTDDYMITGGDGSAAFEKDSVYRYFADDTTNIYERKTATVNINYRGKLAYETGQWTSTRDGVTRAGGNYTAAWRKENGEWKIRSEIYVTLWANRAPNTAKPQK